MKFCIVVGTRPDIIKLAPIIKYCNKNELDYFVIHTGQHYSYNMDKLFFEELELPQPKYNLGIGSRSHAEMTGAMLMDIEKVLINEKPDLVIVLGDTNSTLAGVLAASKLHIKVAHVESGLRSYDRRMPEEINRIVCDHLSDYLFAPTHVAYGNLLQEGLPREKIFISGNTVVDALLMNLEISNKKSKILETFGVESKNYFLLTIHRPENVDDKELLESIFKGLELVYAKYNIEILFPAHPRTKSNIISFNVKIPNFIKLINPVGYLDFIQLQDKARLIFTDSGGIQEESCVLKVPCVILRDHTERTETLDIGSSVLAGTDSNRIFEAACKMMDIKDSWENPFGDGNSSHKIMQYLLAKIK